MEPNPIIHANSELPHTRDMLRDLWRRRLDTLIVGIANGDPYYQQIANAAEHIQRRVPGTILDRTDPERQ